MTPQRLRAQRAAAGISGHAICRLVGMSRAKLSGIETGNTVATPEELERIHAAIESIGRTRQQLTKLAAEAGLSLEGVRI